MPEAANAAKKSPCLPPRRQSAQERQQKFLCVHAPFSRIYTPKKTVVPAGKTHFTSVGQTTPHEDKRTSTIAKKEKDTGGNRPQTERSQGERSYSVEAEIQCLFTLLSQVLHRNLF